jgi:hypothetical protein
VQAAFCDGLNLSNLFCTSDRLTFLIEMFLDGFDQQVLVLLNDDKITDF